MIQEKEIYCCECGEELEIESEDKSDLICQEWGELKGRQKAIQDFEKLLNSEEMEKAIGITNIEFIKSKLHERKNN